MAMAPNPEGVDMAQIVFDMTVFFFAANVQFFIRTAVCQVVVGKTVFLPLIRDNTSIMKL